MGRAADNERSTSDRVWLGLPIGWVALALFALGRACAADAGLVLSDHDRQWLAGHASLRLGFHELSPLVCRGEGTNRFVGLGLDYIGLVERRLGARFERVPHASWSELLDAARNRKVDVVITVPRTPERAAYLDFGPPYYTPLKPAENRNTAGSLTVAHDPREYAMGSRNDWPELARILAQGMAGITPAERDAVWRRWLPPAEPKSSARIRHGLTGLGLGLGLALLVRHYRRHRRGALRGSIRKNLLLVVSFSTLPTFVLILAIGREHRNTSIGVGQREASELAAQTTKWIEKLVRETHEALDAHAGAFRLHAANPEQLVAYANEQLQQQRHLDLFVFDRGGEIVASGRADLIGKVNVAQLEIARKVAEYGDFVVGNSVMSTTYAHPMIHFAVPVKTTRPSVDYFLGKAVQLDTWGLDTDAPAGCPGARLSIMDRDGVLLHNYPPGMDGLGLGQTIPEWLWNRISESVRGESIVADPAGGRWFLAHRALDLDDASAPDLYVVVSAPYAQVAESANRSLRRELLLLLVTTVGSMLIAITLGNRTLVNVLERITEAARRLGQGDLSARIGVTPQQTGELWDLARTIDTMAAGLEQDRALRQRAQEQLRESEEKFAKAFHTSPYAITLTHARDGTLIEVNEAFTRLTGYTRAEVIGQTTLHLALWTNPQDRERIRAALEAGQAVVDEELRFRKRNGEILLGQMSARMIRLQDEPCILSSVADISQRKQAEAEMARQLDELQRWRDTTMEREGRVMELKREINSLLAQMGEAPRYPSAAAEPGHAPTP